MLGSVVDTVLVRGLQVFEHLFPMPARVGTPLGLGEARRANADPVILVGGFANSMSGWDEWKRSLMADGFDVYIFDPPTVGLGDMEDSARAVAAYIELVRKKTGRKVDVVGFSEGGVLMRMAVARYGALGSVDRLVSLATPHGGVPLSGVYDLLKGFGLLRAAVPESGPQLLDGSSLLDAINREDRHLRMSRAPGGPRYASVFSMNPDPIVTPWASALEGAVNVPVRSNRGGKRGPNHFEMFHTSHGAYEAVRELLLDRPTDAAIAAGLLSAR
jgi:pimeloyl-ACP methyl ester carboxylesterase